MRKLIVILLSLAMTVPLCGALSAKADVYPVIIVEDGHHHYDRYHHRYPPHRRHFEHRHFYPAPPPPPPHYGPRPWHPHPHWY
ncbi:hypothetical protein [Bartonella apis]|uniref:Uncharacterized protein n=1 Tax=Bartonella apis TaxID=1686310 RepID=A0A1R0FA74_9HYPH|nr:hypothetical protein [Bartonella apis]MCT6825474.1 hypothetical protein [Bartonella apis]MCT6861424.1 hypothetical protein [Bartonella apis]MCT6887596.1 hypothetical protein [Bartonella apis]OLY43877.1 hypothetical protein PEB0149_013180 [Bartonella apis]